MAASVRAYQAASLPRLAMAAMLMHTPFVPMRVAMKRAVVRARSVAKSRRQIPATPAIDGEVSR